MTDVQTTLGNIRGHKAIASKAANPDEQGSVQLTQSGGWIPQGEGRSDQQGGDNLQSV